MERYSLSRTSYIRFIRWRKAGVWDGLLAAIFSDYSGELAMIASIGVACPPAWCERKKAGPKIVALGVPGVVPRASSMLLSMLADALFTRG